MILNPIAVRQIRRSAIHNVKDRLWDFPKKMPSGVLLAVRAEATGFDELQVSLLEIFSNSSLDIIAFGSKKDLTQSGLPGFTPSDFGWNGKKIPVLIGKKRYNLLIIYTSRPNPYFEWLASACSDAYIIGLKESNNPFLDLMIDCHETDMNTFTAEIEKYMGLFIKNAV